MYFEEYDETTQQIHLQKKGKIAIMLTAFSEGNFFRKCIKHVKKNFKRFRKFLWRNFCAFDEWLGAKVRRHVLKECKVKNNRIVFGTFQNAYACNEKYIAERIRELGLDYELIFIVNNDIFAHKDDYEMPSNVKMVRRNSMGSFYALATAHIWIDNALNCTWKDIPKQPGQIYLNTWHGSLGIKRLGGSKRWCKIAKRANKTIDYFITDSTFEENVFLESFWPDVKHLKYGHPRNDIFFSKEKIASLKKKVYDYYDISYDAKTVLYAPTFRDNKSDVSAIHVDFDRLKRALEKKFGGEWVVISRLHFHNARNKKTKDLFSELDTVIDASQYPDMQELMAAVDVGITDYSSWIFDYLFTGRPAFIYAADIENYVNSRGFYYSLNETPFMIADSNTALCKNIANFEQADFDKKVQKFLEGKGCYEKGTATESTVEFIRQQIENNK